MIFKGVMKFVVSLLFSYVIDPCCIAVFGDYVEVLLHASAMH
jgi:hypothetical protein